MLCVVDVGRGAMFVSSLGWVESEILQGIKSMLVVVGTIKSHMISGCKLLWQPEMRLLKSIAMLCFIASLTAVQVYADFMGAKLLMAIKLPW